MRTIIAGSGKGSNCNALLKAQSKKLIGKTQIIAVVSDKKESGILKVADKHKTPAIWLGEYKSNHHEAYDKLSPQEITWISRIQELEPDLIVLAGFMKILSEPFIDSFRGKIINLHPSLLPSFPGTKAIEKALEAGVKVTGCTVHWVSAEVDCGEIIDQEPVRIFPRDNLPILTRRIHDAEHLLLSSVIKDLSYSFHNERIISD